MSFVSVYSLKKRPKQILADGTEQYPEDAERWALFQQAERVRPSFVMVYYRTTTTAY